jgi:aspartate aminotransferase
MRFEGTPGEWKRITEQKGMFCILGLSLEEVLHLRGKSLLQP